MADQLQKHTKKRRHQDLHHAQTIEKHSARTSNDVSISRTNRPAVTSRKSQVKFVEMVSLLDPDHVANNRATPQTSRPYCTYQVLENTKPPVENPYMAQTIESHHRPGKNYALTRFQITSRKSQIWHKQHAQF